MKLQLENLSVEELKTLHKNINLLFKDKCKPKYEKGTYFINPKDLSFGYILDIIDTNYEISLSSFVISYPIREVTKQYLDDCIIISQEDYKKLLIFENNVREFQYKKQKEIESFIKSLEKEFKNAIQEIVNEYKND